MQAAGSIIDNYCVGSPRELDIETIAYAENLYIKETETSSYYGRLVHNGRKGIITLSSRITEPAAKRFTIAHEMGHFLLEKGFLQMKSNEEHYSCREEDLRGIKTNTLREDRANEFAAELLMYRPWFSEYTKNESPGTEIISRAAGHFNVSLSACAIRYAELEIKPVAVIMSREGKVEWHYPSVNFPLKYLPKGTPVRKYTAAFEYFQSGIVNKEVLMVPATAWYGDDLRCRADIYLHEQSIFMKNYNAVMTLVWEWESR